MAIYHMNAQIIGRSSGRSSTSAIAYRAGIKILDERTGVIHDYTQKKDVDYTVILTPNEVGEWAKDREVLWNKVEESEKRKDSQTAREINIAIPIELSKLEGRELVINYAQENFVDNGMIADICFHGVGSENPHAHIMLTTRELEQDGFGKKNRDWNKKELIETWRESWANHCNKSLQLAGSQERVDHRTLKAQGIDREPTIHLGHIAHAMEQKGRESERGNINRHVLENNKNLQNAKKELQKINEILKEAEELRKLSPEEKKKDLQAQLLSTKQELENKKAQVEGYGFFTSSKKRQQGIDEVKELYKKTDELEKDLASINAEIQKADSQKIENTEKAALADERPLLSDLPQKEENKKVLTADEKNQIAWDKWKNSEEYKKDKEFVEKYSRHKFGFYGYQLTINSLDSDVKKLKKEADNLNKEFAKELKKHNEKGFIGRKLGQGKIDKLRDKMSIPYSEKLAKAKEKEALKENLEKSKKIESKLNEKENNFYINSDRGKKEIQAQKLEKELSKQRMIERMEKKRERSRGRSR